MTNMYLFLALCFIANHVMSVPTSLVPSDSINNTAEHDVFSMISDTKALKNLIKTEDFLADVSSLDPGAIDNVITILQGLADGNQNDIDRYATHEAAALSTKVSKAATLGIYEGELTDLQTTLKETGDVIDSKQNDINRAKLELAAATLSHTAMYDLKTQETEPLRGEITTIDSVIVQLRGISEGYSGSCGQNEILWQEFCYATLGKFDPAATFVGCQKRSLNIPSGWEVAPVIPGVVAAVVAQHPWGTRIIVMADGKGYYSSNDGLTASGDRSTPGNYGGKDKLQCSGISCKPTVCKYHRILIRTPRPVRAE